MAHSRKHTGSIFIVNEVCRYCYVIKYLILTFSHVTTLLCLNQWLLKSNMTSVLWKEKLLKMHIKCFYSHFFMQNQNLDTVASIFGASQSPHSVQWQHTLCLLSSQIRWGFTGKAEVVWLLSIYTGKDCYKLWGPKSKQPDSYLLSFMMMGLHGAVATSLLLTARGFLRQIHHRWFAFYSSKPVSPHWSENQAAARVVDRIQVQ